MHHRKTHLKQQCASTQETPRSHTANVLAAGGPSPESNHWPHHHFRCASCQRPSYQRWIITSEADQHISSRNSLLATAQTTRAHTSGRQSGQPHHQRTNHLHSVTGTALSEHNSARDGYSTRLSNRSSKADEPTETLQQPLLTSCTSAANPEPCSNCNPLQEVLL